jgi:hypothetical protein
MRIRKEVREEQSVHILRESANQVGAGATGRAQAGPHRRNRDTKEVKTMMETGLQVVGVEKVEADAQAAASNTALALQKAESLAITSDVEYQAASVLLREFNSWWKDLEDERKRILKPLDEHRDQIMQFFGRPQGDLLQAVRLLKAKLAAWHDRQQELARLEQARLDEEARVAAEKLQKKAETARLAGHFEKAATLEGAADNVQAAVVEPPNPAAGTYIRETWSADVVDLFALVQAVAAETVPLEALKADMVFLNQQARSLKGRLKYPGVNAVKEKGVSARAGIHSQRSMPGR